MLITTLADFIKSVPTATGTKFEAIAPYIVSADAEIKTILSGSDLYSYIESLEEDALLRIQLCNLIALTAYRNAIPFVDLIQTANGFGIVNGGNIVPASKERVERLIQWCDRVIDRTTDLLITITMQTAAALTEWTKFAGFKDLTNCFFNTGIDFEGYFKQSEMKRKSFLDYKNDLMYCQNNVIGLTFGNPIVNEIIDQIRKNTLTDSNRFVLNQMKQVMGKYANGLRNE